MESTDKLTLVYELRVGLIGFDNERSPEPALKALADRLVDERSATHVKWMLLSDRPSAQVALEVGGAPPVRETLRDDRAIVERCELLLIPDPETDQRAKAAAKHALRLGRNVIAVTADGLRRLKLNGDAIERVAYDVPRNGFARLIERLRGRLPAQPRPPHRWELSLGFVRISAFNREFRLNKERHATSVERRCDQIRGLARESGLPDEVANAITEHLVPLGRKAKLSAESYQWWYCAVIFAVHLTAVVAACALLTEVILLPKHYWLIWIELTLIGVSVALVIWAKKGHFHDRFVFGRYIAEQFRMALYMMPTGYDPLEDLSEHARAQKFLRGSHAWLSPSVAAAVTVAKQDAADHRGSVSARRTFLVEGLLKKQVKWHRGNAHRRHGWAKALQWTTAVLIGVTAVLAVLHLAHVGEPPPCAQIPNYARVDKWIIFFACVIPVVAAGLHGTAHYFSLERAGDRSKHVALALEDLIEQYEHAEDEDELSQLTRSASKIMAAELHDFFVEEHLHPPEPVV